MRLQWRAALRILLKTTESCVVLYCNIKPLFLPSKRNSLCPGVSRLLIYGVYCSQVEIAIAVLDLICKEKEDVRLKLEVRCICTSTIFSSRKWFQSLDSLLAAARLHDTSECFVSGVLKESQQREVFAEGPARCPDAEGPQVPSASAGGLKCIELKSCITKTKLVALWAVTHF